MAEVYRSVGGRKTEKFLATLPEVQADLEYRTFAMAVYAEELLIEHKFEDHSYIEVDKGKVDWYIILNDERGQKAAMSIEYGREGYVDDQGRVRNKMEGLFILHRATHLPIKKRGGVRM